MTDAEKLERDIKEAMAILAKDVAKKAMEVDILTDKVDALKTLAQVYSVLKKFKVEDADEDDGSFSFARGLSPEEPQSNVSQIPARRRPG
jgi:hypothetical protein